VSTSGELDNARLAPTCTDVLRGARGRSIASDGGAGAVRCTAAFFAGVRVSFTPPGMKMLWRFSWFAKVVCADISFADIFGMGATGTAKGTFLFAWRIGVRESLEVALNGLSGSDMESAPGR
jgi:hypothetical protein